MILCPNCQNSVGELIPVDAATAQKSAQLNPGSVLPPSVCKKCYIEAKKSFVSGGGAGGVLMAEAMAKEQHKIQLWKSRVQLVKKARSMMEQKMYSDAALEYEKYIRLLEIVFEAPKGQLTPEKFKEKARTSELTVISSVYWDLLRIYDTSPAYGPRQAATAKQLAKFVPFTPIFPDIIKKAQQYVKSSRNPEIIKGFIKLALRQRPRCFIATAAFMAPMAPEVQTLRAFRDTRLKASPAGRAFVFYYYKFSPPIACLLDKHPSLKPAARWALRLLIKCVS